MTTLIDYLKRVPLFSHLGEAHLARVASRCRRSACKRGGVLFYKTDTGTELYVVLSGRLKAVLIDEDGDEMVLAHFERGAFFGELNLLDGKGRSATVVADETAELAVLGRDAFLEMLAEDPKIAVALMGTLAGRLRRANETIEALAFLEVSERLVRVFLEEESGEAGAGEPFIKRNKLTHKELASLVGASREAVSKGMKVLVTKGIVKEGADHLLVARNALELLKSPVRGY
ncbi:MAG: Crp/Fnr family transcriptional regulator [Nitrospirota bacterium]